ncbi:DUF4129 domain-containing protein [Sphingomonas sp.]|uniref:DUF4129 domain-containing protein n=1 Tax=Sphingomonas sp. TaxID=28214 RepID=UPI000DB021B2|nr:DUF4129 domain-containing protein [Sphingomonas sp.]PZU06600.1 MAG: DUF4129 domain-containing protein [Sphingomonas sp.]
MSDTVQAAHERLAAAHRAFRADPSIQFDLPPVLPPRAPPAWAQAIARLLKKIAEPIGQALHWIGSFMPQASFARVLLWTLLALGVAAILWLVVRQIRWPKRREADVEEAPPEWRPDEAGARSLLEAADRLAAEGRYGEATHLLLQSSVGDIALRRPDLLRPSLTSRDIAGSAALPLGARLAFGQIARLVERNLFAGKPLAEKDWRTAREAYAGFALAGTWR